MGVNFFLIRFYILERFLLQKVYGKTYTQMDETTRRGFVNHHIAGATKILILVLAAYPFIDVAFGSATFHTPFVGSKHVSQGDILIIAAQMLIAMYVFELFYRPKISPTSRSSSTAYSPPRTDSSSNSSELLVSQH